MLPIICHLGPIPVYSYGLFLAIAVIVSGSLMAREALKIGIPEETAYDLVFWVVLWGIIGARTFYVLLNVEYFMSAPLEIIMLQKGGLAWQGSLIAGAISGVLYIRKKKLPVLPFLDVCAPFIALGHAIGRIGCLLNGCCYGKPASWGLFFPVWEARLIPTQIFMSIGQLVIFCILRSMQARQVKAGQIFAWYLLLSAVERFSIEFFRADHDVYAGLSIFQYVSLAVFAGALIFNQYLVRRK
ncbi:MAG: prolipoprotein diacylglyceryl transferase [Candidatus Omnitrophica bacterium]|nr:prolipoprotein diacylglyceryl transferase [Candidatus Omnitrophota bacterium]